MSSLLQRMRSLNSPQWRPFLVLFLGISIAATAAIMIRYAFAEGVPALSVAAGRMTLAALILTPLAWGRAGSELRGLTRRELLPAAAGGVLLALHFASWISSLEYTSVASSAALVSTNPLWVGLLSWLVLRERLGPAVIIGIGLSIAGTLMIGISDSSTSSGSNPLLGNTLALIGALTSSGYLLIGRSLGRRVSILPYIWLVYSSAAVVLLGWVLLSGLPWFGFSPLAWLMLIGLAVGPQLLGHTSFNYALGMLSASYVAVAILGEPLATSVLAWLIFGETVQPLQLAGLLVLLIGIVVASRAEARR
jgi:drug/metabolite transporter (DMT)-like permease